MKARAVARFVRVTPRKARLVVDLIRGKPVDEALAILRFTPRKAARVVEKVLRSAIANAENVHDIKGDLTIAEAYVDEGPTWKRWRPRMRGMATPILKRTSHITVVVSGEKEAG